MKDAKHRLIVVALAACMAATPVPPAARGEGPPPAPGSTVADLPAPPSRAVVVHATRTGKSLPLREIAHRLPEGPRQDRPPRERSFIARTLPGEARPPAAREDPLRQTASAGDPMPDPVLDIEGQSNADNEEVVGFRLLAADTNGDVGPNHYVQWINIILSVYDKTDGTRVLGPIAGNQIFDGMGGPCELENDGDPTVVYDQFADRWVLSQFVFLEAQCVAVSESSDPTGAYHLYEFPTPNNDYPKMGVWPDAYYMTYRRLSGRPEFIQAVALERDKMLVGDPTAASVRIGISDPPDGMFDGILPPHVEGLVQPPAGAPAPYVMSFDDEAFSDNPDPERDFYKIWHFSVDWDDPESSVMSDAIDVPTAEMDIDLCGYAAPCVEQPDVDQLLDTLSFLTMWRAVYHGGTDALWVNNTVDADGDDTAGIRWAEIGDPLTAPTVRQAGTYAPADGDSRWMGSLAVDADGNMALGYSVSSAATYPSIRYAGRLADDPPGVLARGEAELQAGTGSQTEPHRWGDYSSMSLDESDGCTFWYTTEYYAETGPLDFRSRIGSFRFPTCGAGDSGTVEGTVTELITGAPVGKATVEAVGAETFSTQADEMGVYSLTVTAGTYDVTASKEGFEPQTVPGVEVAAEATEVVDFALQPEGVASFAPAALEIDGDEVTSDGNGVFEPGEQVEAAPAWHNEGTAAGFLTGMASGFTGPEGAIYTLAAADAEYGTIEPGESGSCRDSGVCYRLAIDAPTVRPATHWETSFDETLDDTEGMTRTWTVHIGESFADVPPSNLFYPAIETLLHHGVTGGCADTEYCPGGGNTRDQMAVFLLRAAEGDPDYAPPACTEGEQRFDDVPFDSPFCPWIEELADREVTSGCGGDSYCPGDAVTRAQMAVFLLKAALGGGYTPPACTHEFDDVPCPSTFVAWIEDLAARGITGGCGNGNYCPEDVVTRGQMAVFVTRAFGLALYGP